MKRILCVILACVLLCLSAGCSRVSHETVFAMDTVMDLQIWGADNEKAVQTVTYLLQDMEELYSVHNADSLISALNRGEDKLSSENRMLLEKIQALSVRTGGAFDPKLLAVSSLWGFGTDDAHLPMDGEIAAALKEKKWDLGGALKGYAGQQAVARLEQLDVSHAILNLGGNVQTYGKKPDGSPWSIGIQNPAGGDYLGIVSVVGTASVVTSGDYQRYFEKDGVRYHHILDPQTGKPARSGLSSVTVICKDGLTADCLSTALFVMGLEKATAFWRQSDDFEAVFITNEGDVFATEGAALSGCEHEVIGR